MRMLLTRLSVAVCLAACLDPIRPKPPLEVRITATPPTGAVGTEFTFVVNAQGHDLLSVEAHFGDGSSEVFNTGGATTARVNFIHTYNTAGTYDVIGLANDGVEGQKQATVQITVQ
jgi:PKD repeat protein